MATVLVVDDSVSLRKLVATTLAKVGHQVIEASNGEAALAALKGRLFNTIITDLNMPVMDGFTFITNVRAISAYRFTPILVLTTEMGAERKAQAKAIGATGWLVKPFDPPQLLATISRVLA